MLSEAERVIAGYNIFLNQQLKEILSAFKKHNTEAMLLKGLALAESIYPHLGRRPMADIDLLIKPRSLILASKVLVELGYKLNLGNSGYSYTKNGVMLSCVDLHTDIACFPAEEVWAKARRVELNGFSALTLSLEDTLIFLCYHMAVCHAYPYRRWLEDIHLFVTHYKKEIIWQELIKRIKAYRLDMPCYWCLLKTKEIFKTPIPDNLFSSLKSSSLLKHKIFQWIFQSKKPIPYIDYLSSALIYSPRRLFSTIFPPLESLQLRYNMKPPALYFCYILRPISLLIKGAKGIWGLILR